MKLKPRAPKQVELNPQSRRMFLKSVGGLNLALPFLPSLLTTLSENAYAASARPKRFVSLYTPSGGLQHKNWLGPNLPTSTFNLYSNHQGRMNPISSLLSNNALSPVISSAYQNVFSHMNLIAGVDQPFYFGHNRSVGLGTWAYSVDGQRVPQDQHTFYPTTMPLEYPSIDQVLQFAGNNGIYNGVLGGRRRSLNVSTSARTSFGRKDYFNVNNPVLPLESLNSTAGVFQTLFGSVDPSQMGGGTPTANPLINLVNEFWPSGKTLMRALSKEDRTSLEQLFDLAQKSADEYSFPVGACSATQPVGTGTEQIITVDSYRALADIIAMAFKCDITRVVNVCLQGPDHEGHDWHKFSHEPNPEDLTTKDKGQPEIVAIVKNISENFFARLANNLLVSDPLDSSNSILNNSLMYWTHEHKSAHENISTPTLMIGSAAGRINTGNFIDLRNMAKYWRRDAVGDPHYEGDIINRVWATIFHAMDISRSSYEVPRGGGSSIMYSLDKGYGHAVISPINIWDSFPNYNLSRIGEPWEFIAKSGVSWD